MEQEPQAMPRALSSLVSAADRFASFVGRYWALALSAFFFLFVALAFVPPLLMRLGAETPARVLYTVYGATCHQLPERSYFIFGENAIYSVDDLRAEGVVGDSILSRRYYIGDHEHGYKLALCERDIAIYGAMFLTSLFLARRRGRLTTLPLKFYALLVLPIAIDGLTQLAGLRTSNWWLRTLTGVLFGAATIWFIYPYLVGTIVVPGQKQSQKPEEA